MKILHVGLIAHFTEGLLYQDNMLCEQNIKDGHDVVYVSDCHEYIDGKLTSTPEEDRFLRNGLRLVRLQGIACLGDGISQKLCFSTKLGEIIDEIAPSVIMYHGMYGLGLLTVAAYKREHPEVRLCGDVHQNFTNSARVLLSRYILHGFINRILLRKTLPFFDKVFCIGLPECNFARDAWKIPKNRLELLPLGGVIPSDHEYRETRKTYRTMLGVSSNEPLFLHSGKLDSLKRTKLLIEAFSKVSNISATLCIAGSILENREDLLALFQKDDRIHYVGWANKEDLIGYLCAADVYVQPGSVSATLQNALGCRCAGIVNPNDGYAELFGDALWYADSASELARLLELAVHDHDLLASQREKAFACAKKLLDYKQIARRCICETSEVKQ